MLSRYKHVVLQKKKYWRSEVRRSGICVISKACSTEFEAALAVARVLGATVESLKRVQPQPLKKLNLDFEIPTHPIAKPHPRLPQGRRRTLRVMKRKPVKGMERVISASDLISSPDCQSGGFFNLVF